MMAPRNGAARARHASRAACPGQRAGFTLIEVLVAVAIVATALAAGSRAASSVIDTSQRVSDITMAQWCADNQLTELHLVGGLPAIGSTTFTCEQLGHTFNGVVKSQTTPNPNFRRVDVSIANADDRQLLTISTVIGDL